MAVATNFVAPICKVLANEMDAQRPHGRTPARSGRNLLRI